MVQLSVRSVTSVLVLSSRYTSPFSELPLARIVTSTAFSTPTGMYFEMSMAMLLSTHQKQAAV